MDDQVEELRDLVRNAIRDFGAYGEDGEDLVDAIVDQIVAAGWPRRSDG